jgi:hypothetical protein
MQPDPTNLMMGFLGKQGGKRKTKRKIMKNKKSKKNKRRIINSRKNSKRH